MASSGWGGAGAKTGVMAQGSWPGPWCAWPPTSRLFILCHRRCRRGERLPCPCRLLGTGTRAGMAPGWHTQPPPRSLPGWSLGCHVPSGGVCLVLWPLGRGLRGALCPQGVFGGGLRGTLCPQRVLGGVWCAVPYTPEGWPGGIHGVPQPPGRGLWGAPCPQRVLGGGGGVLHNPKWCLGWSMSPRHAWGVCSVPYTGGGGVALWGAVSPREDSVGTHGAPGGSLQCRVPEKGPGVGGGVGLGCPFPRIPPPVPSRCRRGARRCAATGGRGAGEVGRRGEAGLAVTPSNGNAPRAAGRACALRGRDRADLAATAAGAGGRTGPGWDGDGSG